jgi:formylglycine-generating enzyme required for sulfatase activity
VTFDEWDPCAADGGCNGYKPSDEGWGRGWDDAKAYVAWLSEKTGKSYRLLSGAEYEYATRAGTQTAYPWGDTIGTNNANCHACGSQWDAPPVGSFGPNRFGLYDMLGNVREWTRIATTPPTSAHRRTVRPGSRVDCSHRVVRAGSWLLGPVFLRWASRYWFGSDWFQGRSDACTLNLSSFAS